MEQALRREKSTLAFSGFGAIVFGIWICLKSILYELFAKSYLSGLFESTGSGPLERRTAMLVLLGCAIAAMLLHLYIGLRAIREAKGGKKRHSFYLVLAALLLLLNAAEIPVGIAAMHVDSNLMDALCDLLLELAECVNLALLLTAAVRLRRLKREAEEASDHAA